MTIAVLICGLIFDCQKRIINGIKECATEKGCNVFVFTCMGDVFITNEYSKGEFSIFSLPDFSTFDGVILAGNTIMYENTVDLIVKKIRDANVPTISIDRKIPGLAAIYSDNKNAMMEMVNHLIYHHQYKRIMFLAGPEANIESQERLEGYFEAMEKAGIQVKPNWYIYQDFTEKSGEIAASYFIDASSELPEVIVCANDIMAISTANALKSRGIKIPETIAVTGFDYTIDARLYFPQISSVNRFQEATGYKALAYLIDIVNGKDSPEKFIETTTELVCSTSCGCKEHFPYSNSQLRGFLSNAKSKISSETQHLKNLYTRSISLNKHSDFYSSLRSHFSEPLFSQFYLCMKCLSEKEDENTYFYSKKSVLNIAINKQSNIEEYENIVFSTKSLLPENIKSLSSPLFLFFLPIHAIEHTLGYVVLDSLAPMESEIFYTSILNIGLLYENIKNKIKLKTTVEKLDELWIHDSLTELYNRNGFMKHAKEVIRECVYRDQNLLVLFIDVDNLKYVNDNFGHFEGDSYLLHMSQVLVESKTQIKLIMRYGGDEFVVFSPGHTEETASQYIQSIMNDIKEKNKQVQKPYEMDMSIGYIIKKVSLKDKPDDLISEADTEMYLVKNKKKHNREFLS